MTNTFGLIGYPIKHSLSPWIHNQFMKQLNIEGTYQLFEIEREDLFAEKIKRLKEIEVDGFNVTVPYKEKILPYLDEIDEQAKEVGAVNTVLCKNDSWIGYNTDGVGYMRALLNDYPHLEKHSRILLIGAGGAAKGILHALLQHGFKQITITNRTIVRAEELAAVHSMIATKTLKEVESNLHSYDVIIQTTSVGMKPNETKSPITLQHVNKQAIVSDIVYQPLKTTLLQEAEKNNLSIHLGHTMLLYQAQYAFEIWTGQRPEVAPLIDPLENILKG